MKKLKIPSRIRPTSNKVREALFSILYSEYGDLSEARFIDCFAGSGAIGIQALEKNCSEVIFFEKEASNMRFIQDNLKSHDYQALVVKRDLCQPDSMERLEGEYNIIFADPPYALEYEELILFLEQIPFHLADDGIFIFEFSTERIDFVREFMANYLKEVKYKEYGDTCLVFWTRH